jgi:Xaa-Pro aminopeptidase
MITQDGKVALGVPTTDVEDVRQLAHFDHIVGFEDEVGMIHSIAHHFEHFGRGVRVEDTVVVGVDGPTTLTAYPRQLEK